MKTWTVEYMEEAKKDIKDLDNSQTSQVIKAIDRVSQNPLPNTEGGYGKLLGNIVISIENGLRRGQNARVLAHFGRSSKPSLKRNC